MTTATKGQKLYQDAQGRWRCDCRGKPVLRIMQRDAKGRPLALQCWAGTKFDLALRHKVGGSHGH